MKYEAVIGLEIHVQLNTVTKLFCDCPNHPGDEPNRNTCPVCLWLPGSLPVLSQEALEKAITACLALNSEIQPESAFDQKVYYYPDLPKGYQLSQHHQPLARNGWIDILNQDNQLKRLRIHHIHLEEDVARLAHAVEGSVPISLVDFNRAGAPLIEIVSEPDMRHPEEAMAYIQNLRAQLRYTGAAECSLEQGALRVDANISLRPAGSDVMHTKIEVKNMNSIQAVGDAIAYEIQRQTACLEKGESINLHTRLWNADKQITVPMRAKFSGPCVPDPSVPFIRLSPAQIDLFRQQLPEMPSPKTARFIQTYHLTPEQASALCLDRDMADFFEAAAKHQAPLESAANWIIHQLTPMLKERHQSLQETCLTPLNFVHLLTMMAQDIINMQAAKDVLQQLLDSQQTPEEIVEKAGLRQLSDQHQLEALVKKILLENPADAADYQQGNQKVLSYFMGLAMKASQGKANPKRLREVLLHHLNSIQ